MNALRASILMAGLFLAGLLAGVWSVIAPWVIGYPPAGAGSWSSLTWASVWAGAVVLTAGGAGLVTTTAVLPAMRSGEDDPTGDRP